ncbi:MAG: hypothetical protein that often co-occurs with aconitase [uncultured Sphingomonadaceae bacterium]|uniref:DUF1223 domain-containing protein n=1 Tax=uncultured Sphingomonadaceae bacterium TaxID=169976 RepID=A0A6J4SWQ5_9SPHN|nr:MAG: hypothetical protein that often co-occurs with aconitase [uncultured Sphingomonadaceae bacterium]
MPLIRAIIAGSALLSGAALLLSAGSSIAHAADAARPTVIELYQSQGCSSCPPANAILNRLAKTRPDLLPLSFAVTYWDRLGWKDEFAAPAYTQRQYDYAGALWRGNVATPQFVVNGRRVVTGSDARELGTALRAADRGTAGPAIGVQGGRVLIGVGKPAASATVWLVRYDPRERVVKIGSGENGGRALPHRNIVTGLRPLGVWTGAPVSFPQPAYRDPAQRSAVLLQQGRGGPIVAAGRI